MYSNLFREWFLCWSGYQNLKKRKHRGILNQGKSHFLTDIPVNITNLFFSVDSENLPDFYQVGYHDNSISCVSTSVRSFTSSNYVSC
jgi:hypothetical protein